MKKIYILLFMFFLLFSCWTRQEKIIDEGISTWVTSSWTWSEILASWTWNEAWNLEVNSWKIELVKEEKKVKNNRKLILKNKWNVYLSEPWKEDVVLTTRAKWYKYCEEPLGEKWIYKYEILISEWKYWLVGRTFEQCELPWIKSLYWINLDNPINDKTVLTDISDKFSKIHFDWDTLNEIDMILNPYEYFNNWRFKVNKNNLHISIDKKTILLEETDGPWYRTSVEDVKKFWFIDKWTYFEKILDLQKVLPDIKETENNITSDKKIKNNVSSKIPDKFKPENLIKQWYKVNNLWETKEYYKKDEKSNWKIDDIWWSVSHKTVYIRWDKYLYIESITHWWHLWGAWWTITIENKDWEKYFNENDEVFSVFEEWEIKNWELAVQTIFKRKDSSKLFVNSDLTRVTMVSLDWKINKVIWKWN